MIYSHIDATFKLLSKAVYSVWSTESVTMLAFGLDGNHWQSPLTVA